jgi:cell wall-associated NlpC family hydrolase
VTPSVASHKRACRRRNLLRGTGVVVSTLAVAGFTASAGHAEPAGGTANRGAGKGAAPDGGAAGKPAQGGSGTRGPQSASAAEAFAATSTAVEQQVADLYQQVDAATQQYDATEERIAQLQAAVSGESSKAAQLRNQLATASAGLGRLAAEQYRDAGMSPEMALVFATHPDAYLEKAGVDDRLADLARQRVLAALIDQQQLNTLERESAASLADLKAAQTQLAAHRADIEARLADARNRLDMLGAAQRQQVTAALAGSLPGDGLGTTVSVAAPTLSSLLAAVAASTANASPGATTPSTPKPATGPSTAASPSAPASAANPTATASPGAVPANGAAPDNSADQSMSAGDEARIIKAISAAYGELGRPYVWGATGPDEFDCSGLTQHVWAAAGVMLPRTSQEQADAGESVPLSDIRPGDLVIYYPGDTHVGIYVGQGLVIHAPRPGSYVQFAPVDSMPIDKIVRPVR